MFLGKSSNFIKDIVNIKNNLNRKGGKVMATNQTTTCINTDNLIDSLADKRRKDPLLARLQSQCGHIECL